MNLSTSQKTNCFSGWCCFSLLAWIFILIFANISLVASQEYDPAVLLSEVVFAGKVVTVISGDTLEVNSSGETRKVRLESIDAPEDGQAYSKVAREFLSKLVLRKSVTVHARMYDWSGEKVSLGHVVIGEADLSSKMIEAGLSWSCNKPFSNSVLRALESEARSKKNGLWQESNPIPPWQFRGEKECFEEGKP